MTRSKSRRRKNLKKKAEKSLISKQLFDPDISNGTFVPNFKPDLPRGRCCVASNYNGDWLMFIDKPVPRLYYYPCSDWEYSSYSDRGADCKCFLWNPLLRYKVQLPSLPWEDRNRKCLVSCCTVPIGDGQVKTERCCYTVYVLSSTSRYMWCSEQFHQWEEETHQWEEDTCNERQMLQNSKIQDVAIQDVVLFGPGETADCICGITRSGLFYSSNLQMQPPTTFNLWGDVKRLVVYRGEERDRLFLLKRRLCSWEVWEVDFLQRSWVSVSNLEGIVVFLNDTLSAAYSDPQLEGNCIFFTGFGDTENCYVGSLADKSFSALKNQPHSGFPAWFPNVMNINRVTPLLRFVEKYVRIVDKEPADCVAKPIPAEEDNFMNELTQLGLSESGGVSGNVYLELPADLQRFIAEYVSAMDHANLRLVCRILRENVPPICWKPDLSSSTPIQFPWLMLFGEKESHSSIIDPACNMKYYYSNEELLGCKIRCCKDGWLLVTQGSHTVFFIEPFSKIKICLPNLPEGLRILAMSFSSSPASSDWIIISVFAMADQYRVMYLRSTSGEWNIVPHQVVWVSNTYTGVTPVFHDHSFYIFCYSGELVKFWWEEEAHELRFHHWRPDGGFEFNDYCDSGYLVSCENDLYLVVLAPLGKTVNMYKQDKAAAKWKRVKSMENFAFFISETSSVAVPVLQRREQGSINLCLFVDNRHLFYNLNTEEFRCLGDDDDSRRTEIYGRKQFLNGTWIQPQVVRGYRYS